MGEKDLREEGREGGRWMVGQPGGGEVGRVFFPTKLRASNNNIIRWGRVVSEIDRTEEEEEEEEEEEGNI